MKIIESRRLEEVIELATPVFFAHPAYSALVLVARGLPWTPDSQEIIRFRTWCLKHRRQCRKNFRFYPNPKMSAIQCFHAALHHSFSINPVRILESGDLERVTWTVASGDREVVWQFFCSIVAELC